MEFDGAAAIYPDTRGVEIAMELTSWLAWKMVSNPKPLPLPFKVIECGCYESGKRLALRNVFCIVSFRSFIFETEKTNINGKP